MRETLQKQASPKAATRQPEERKRGQPWRKETGRWGQVGPQADKSGLGRQAEASWKPGNFLFEGSGRRREMENHWGGKWDQRDTMQSPTLHGSRAGYVKKNMYQITVCKWSHHARHLWRKWSPSFTSTFLRSCRRSRQWIFCCNHLLSCCYSTTRAQIWSHCLSVSCMIHKCSSVAWEMYQILLEQELLLQSCRLEIGLGIPQRDSICRLLATWMHDKLPLAKMRYPSGTHGFPHGFRLLFLAAFDLLVGTGGGYWFKRRPNRNWTLLVATCFDRDVSVEHFKQCIQQLWICPFGDCCGDNDRLYYPRSQAFDKTQNRLGPALYILFLHDGNRLLHTTLALGLSKGFWPYVWPFGHGVFVGHHSHKWIW